MDAESIYSAVVGRDISPGKGVYVGAQWNSSSTPYKLLACPYVWTIICPAYGRRVEVVWTKFLLNPYVWICLNSISDVHTVSIRLSIRPSTRRPYVWTTYVILTDFYACGRSVHCPTVRIVVIHTLEPPKYDVHTCGQREVPCLPLGDPSSSIWTPCGRVPGRTDAYGRRMDDVWTL